MATIIQIRTLVNDTGATPILTDSDYQIIIDVENNVYRAAATAAKMLSAHFARKVAVTAGPVKVESQQKSKRYLEIADSYDQRAREGGGSGADTAAMAPSLSGVSISDIDANNEDTDRYAGTFSRGMDDNETSTTPEEGC